VRPFPFHGRAGVFHWVIPDGPFRRQGDRKNSSLEARDRTDGDGSPLGAGDWTTSIKRRSWMERGPRTFSPGDERTAKGCRSESKCRPMAPLRPNGDFGTPRLQRSSLDSSDERFERLRFFQMRLPRLAESLKAVPISFFQRCSAQPNGHDWQPIMSTRA